MRRRKESAVNEEIQREVWVSSEYVGKGLQ